MMQSSQVCSASFQPGYDHNRIESVIAYLHEDLFVSLAGLNPVLWRKESAWTLGLNRFGRE